MSVLNIIEGKVESIALERNMKSDRAFGFWFLEDIEDLSAEDAEDTVTDGPWDGGRDAVLYNQEEQSLRIYQMKYSETREYVINAFNDLQRGLKSEYEKNSDLFKHITSLTLCIVTKYEADESFINIQKTQQRHIRSWLTRKGHSELSRNTTIEIFDLKKFAQLMERLYGVDLELEYRNAPLKFEENIIGLIDARGFLPFIDREELLAFNIRKFLGIRAGSVNSKIKETLEDDDLRNSFWTFNNGIVCLCTDIEKISDLRFKFNNLTIVNGAQTVSTISKFLEENELAKDQPIWVVCKILRVYETDLEKATKLTQTSNTQTPASGKDLRAVDQIHVRLEKWFAELGYLYKYKRGGIVTQNGYTLHMKDIAQAYYAFTLEKPNIAFSRAGTIFSSNDLYNKVFPTDEIDTLYKSGTKDEQLEFARTRLLPALILQDVRTYLQESVVRGEDRKWKSMAFHIVYAYGVILKNKKLSELKTLIDVHEKVVSQSIKLVYKGFQNTVQTLSLEIPRDLKSEVFQEKLNDTYWFNGYFGDDAKIKIDAVLDSD
jgi:hypothetical protein